MPIYLMTSIKAPKQMVEDIDKMRRHFLWAGDSELTGGKCKVAWTTVAKPVEYGGLGIIELDKFSRALRLRWLWFQWTNPERPWNGTAPPVDTVDMALFSAPQKSPSEMEKRLPFGTPAGLTAGHHPVCARSCTSTAGAKTDQ